MLGCSHYPYLLPIIREIVPSTVQIIDSGEAVAKQTKHILGTYKLLDSGIEEGYITFYTNIDNQVICKICKNFFDKKQHKVLKLSF